WGQSGQAEQNPRQGAITCKRLNAEFKRHSAPLATRRLAAKDVTSDEHQVGLGMSAPVRRRLLLLENSGLVGSRCSRLFVEIRLSWCQNWGQHRVKLGGFGTFNVRFRSPNWTCLPAYVECREVPI